MIKVKVELKYRSNHYDVDRENKQWHETDFIETDCLKNGKTVIMFHILSSLFISSCTYFGKCNSPEAIAGRT
jgi:hypothetical protein